MENITMPKIAQEAKKIPLSLLSDMRLNFSNDNLAKISATREIRETKLLSIIENRYISAIGFDIAENILEIAVDNSGSFAAENTPIMRGWVETT